MEQIRTDGLVNLFPFGGRFIVVHETEAQKTRSALTLQDILRNGTQVRSRDLGSKEAASRCSIFNYLIADKSVNGKAPPFDFSRVTSQSPLHSYTTKILVNLQVYPVYPRILHFYCTGCAKRLSWAGGKL